MFDLFPFGSNDVFIRLLDYIPVYFQACKDANPITAGVLGLGLASIAPFSVIGGISVKVLQIYRPQTWAAWALQIIGSGLLTSINVHSSTAKTIGFCVIFGVGAGYVLLFFLPCKQFNHCMPSGLIMPHIIIPFKHLCQ